MWWLWNDDGRPGVIDTVPYNGNSELNGTWVHIRPLGQGFADVWLYWERVDHNVE